MRSRALPPRPRPPDPARPVAPHAPTDGRAAASDHAAAKPRPSATRQRCPQPAPARTPAKTPLSTNVPAMLAPMGLRRGRLVWGYLLSSAIVAVNSCFCASALCADALVSQPECGCGRVTAVSREAGARQRAPCLDASASAVHRAAGSHACISSRNDIPRRSRHHREIAQNCGSIGLSEGNSPAARQQRAYTLVFGRSPGTWTRMQSSASR
jgi:hypothetical protein